MRGSETDYMISGPLRGLNKTAFDGANRQTIRQRDRHGNSMTESAHWGRFSEKQFKFSQSGNSRAVLCNQKCPVLSILVTNGMGKKHDKPGEIKIYKLNRLRVDSVKTCYD